MPIIFVEGDLLNPITEEAIAHGCNQLGVMGAGIAKAIKQFYPPSMFGFYSECCRENKIKGGDVIVFRCRNYPILFNWITQENVTTKKALLDWIETALRKTIRICNERGIKSVGLPKIGAGLGGLNWQDVKNLFVSICEQEKLQFVCYENYKAAVNR